MSDKKVTLEEFEKFKKELNKNNKKYITDWIVVLIISIFLIGALLLNYFFLKDLKENYFISSKNTIITEGDSEVFAKRFENLELKYIDTVASKESINFWFTILSILAPFIIGYSLYERNEMKKNMQKEIDELNKRIKKSEELLGNIEIKSERYLKNIKEEAKKEMKQIVDEADKQRRISEYFSKGYDLLIEGNKSGDKSKYKEGIEMYDKVIELNDKDFSTYFNRACGYSLLKNKEKMFKDLNKCIELKYFDIVEKRENFYTDKDFNNFRKDDDFITFVEDLKKKHGDK